MERVEGYDWKEKETNLRVRNKLKYEKLFTEIIEIWNVI